MTMFSISTGLSSMYSRALFFLPQAAFAPAVQQYVDVDTVDVVEEVEMKKSLALRLNDRFLKLSDSNSYFLTPCPQMKKLKQPER